jgi:hypothetical protein
MHCKECGKEAKIVEGNLVKECECKAPVIAEMKAEVIGEGGIKA